MSTTAQVINGKVVTSYTTGTNLSEDKTGTDSLDKDAFLQILVAEMQYQDPLEPSSNTEWVTQMASFSQIESINDLGDNVSEQGAYDIVGKRVIIADTNETTGDTNYVTGIVECTEKVNDELYFSVNGNLYSIDKLYSVVDEDYYNSLMEEINQG